jgi:biopolymer transport protein ExbD
MFFGTLTLYDAVPAALLSPVYIVPFLAVLGVLIYLFGVKFAYFGQVCEIALPKEEVSADNNDN